MTTIDIAQKVKSTGKRLDKMKQDKAELDGRRKQLIERLNSEFSIDSVDKANERISSLEEEVEAMESDLTEMSGELDDLMEEIQDVK